MAGPIQMPLSNICQNFRLEFLSSPEEKKLVEAVVWVVLPRSLLRTTTESLRYDRLMSYASIGDWLLSRF